MKKLLLQVVQGILVIVILFCGWKIFSYYQDNTKYTKMEKAVQETSALQDKPNIRVQAIQKLHCEYPDVIGWIHVEGTTINAPIVQGKDDAYYLNHTFQKEEHPFGAIFMAADNTSDFSDFNSVLYGHNVKSGKVFHDLLKFREKDFLNQYGTIQITTWKEIKTYQVKACYVLDPYFDYRKPEYQDPKAFLQQMEPERISGSAFEKTPEHLITLSTCETDNSRFVVQAVLQED